MVKIVTVIGNRPQFVKAAIVSRRWRERFAPSELTEYVVHTGQHYDPMLSDVFFNELGMNPPDVNLHVGSGPIIDQIGVMLPQLARVFEEQRPDGLLVYGDTNSTVAAALAAAHLHIPIFHVEAGERNYRRRLAPEEVNRVVTDELAWLCLTSTEKAQRYLLREGFAEDRVHWVGDPMYDLFCWAQPLVEQHATTTPASLGVEAGEFVLATIHRNENTATLERLIEILSALDQGELPTVLPLHPRVSHMLDRAGWQPARNLKLIGPLGYFDMLGLLREAKLCVTDSGGLAREAFFSRKPAVVPLPNSGWNEIVEAGWITVVPGAGADLAAAITNCRAPSHHPEGLFGDGFSAVRIGEAIIAELGRGRPEGSWHPLGSFDDIPQPNDESGLTLAAYRTTLQAMLDQEISFKPLSELATAPGVAVALRHDVDWSLDDALQLAQAEADLGIRGTFRVRMDGSAFNPLEPASRAALTRIRELGHEFSIAGTLEKAQAEAARALLESITGGAAIVEVDKESPQLPIREASAEALRSNVRTTLIVDVSEWQVHALSAFEKGQRIVDRLHTRLRSDIDLGQWMGRR